MKLVAHFWVFPIIGAAMWLATLLAMLVTWLTQGSPIYPSMDPGQTVAFISDVGAQGLKPLFIAGCVVTTLFLDIGFVAERWLRHTGVLSPNTTTAEKVLSVFAIIFAVAGTAGLILLSIFDTLRHPKMHDGFLLLFIAGYIISAIFICAEYQRLGIHFRDQRILRTSFWIKLVFIIVEVTLAIAFGVCNFTPHHNAAAILEWVIALVFTAWVLSFFIDLLPAERRRRTGGGKAERLEMGNARPMEDRYSNSYGIGMANGHPSSGFVNEMTPPFVNGHGHSQAYGSEHELGYTGQRPVTPAQNI